MSKALGIDLGTTNSVGAFSEVGVEIVTGADNTSPERKLTRSIVSWGSNLKRDRLQGKLFGLWSFERPSWCWQGSHARDNPEK